MNRLSWMSEEEREYSLSMAVDDELPAAEDEIHDDFDRIFGHGDDATTLWDQVVESRAFRSLARARAEDNVRSRERWGRE